jgi:hypothetical protein
MPKPLKKKTTKPRKDPNQAAHALVQRLGGDALPPLDFEAQYKAHMAKLGKKGGKVGGARRMETMTPERRSEVALKAARARWEKAAKKR